MTQPTWITPRGDLGLLPALIPVEIPLVASPVDPATSVSYTLISGTLPEGLLLSSTGVISGVPALSNVSKMATFTIRVTDNLLNIRDRSFTLSVSGIVKPRLLTPSGLLFTTQDSIWIDYRLDYNNPYPSYNVEFSIASGNLPPGLEMDATGHIRGYPNPPVINYTLPPIETEVTATEGGTNIIKCGSTNGFTSGRPVKFSTAIGGLSISATYYIKSIVSADSFTVSTTQDGPIFTLSDDNRNAGGRVLVQGVNVGSPAKRTYIFTVNLTSTSGNDSRTYSILVENQNFPGNPGKPLNTRIPAILNAYPLTFNIPDNDPYRAYYVHNSPDFLGAHLGTFYSDDYFSYKVIGHDFDQSLLTYEFVNLPLGLHGDVNTGWITGNPVISSKTGISKFQFKVRVFKKSNNITTNSISSEFYYFTFSVSTGIKDVITWLSPEKLGTILNGTTCTLSVKATAEFNLEYMVVDGNLPTNLTMLPNGEIIGLVPHQPRDRVEPTGTITTYTFTVDARSTDYTTVVSTKTFTIDVLQEFRYPTENIYIKATPSLRDRAIIDSLLKNDQLIPPEHLYRPTDPNFGKANSVIYQHAFGINANNIHAYLRATMTHHYWRNITLGNLKTAVARNEAGEIIYEVVYSEVIDNLKVNEPMESPLFEDIERDYVVWPTRIDLMAGPWYTSVSSIFTAYDFDYTYFDSLTPGYVQVLFPNSLLNMRNKIIESLGNNNDVRLLPLWMTSQQRNGSTLGFVPAWVICYTLPGKSEEIKANIETWEHTLNEIHFRMDRFTVDKSMTYNYSNETIPGSWVNLPSAMPTPDPKNTKDFHVLFDQKTILPRPP